MKIMQSFAKILLAAVAVISLASFTAPSVSAANSSGSGGGDSSALSKGACSGNIDEDLKKQAGCSESRQLDSVGRTLINAVISVVILAAIAVIVIGGIQYSASLGDPGKAKTARNVIIYGVIGLVVAIFAFAIVNFVIDVALGGDGSGSSSNSSSSANP